MPKLATRSPIIEPVVGAQVPGLYGSLLEMIREADHIDLGGEVSP